MRAIPKSFLAVPLTAVLALGALAIGSAARPAEAADHLDAPTVKTDGRVDINDMYVFEGHDSDNTVLVMTINPAAGVLSPTTFRQGASYEYMLDMTGDAIHDARLFVKFEGVRRGGWQRYSVELRAHGDSTPLVKRAVTGEVASLDGGGMAWAGVADDPFFFDLAAFQTFKSTLLNTGTLDGLSAFCNPDGENFFTGFNASVIVLEVPDELLGGDTVKIWGRTRIREGDVRNQVERMGLPTINTVFNHTDAAKEAYNRAEPRNDVATYSDDVSGLVDLITGLAGTGAPGYGDTVAGLLLPDVITYDTDTAADFTALNGRALDDDVIDVALSVVANTSLSDCVENDSAFGTTFPYVAPAN